MTNKESRERTRAKARAIRNAAKAESERKRQAANDQIWHVLDKAQVIIVDEGFRAELLHAGVSSVPAIFSVKKSQQLIAGRSSKIPTKYFRPHHLEFAVAWTFFNPLFKDKAVSQYLEDRWPGFTIEMKDAFIALVVDGPIPQYA